MAKLDSGGAQPLYQITRHASVLVTEAFLPDATVATLAGMERPKIDRAEKRQHQEHSLGESLSGQPIADGFLGIGSGVEGRHLSVWLVKDAVLFVNLNERRTRHFRRARELVEELEVVEVGIDAAELVR